MNENTNVEQARPVDAQPSSWLDAVAAHVGALDKYIPCMSYNDSYFTEPAGLVKRTVRALSKLVDEAPRAAAGSDSVDDSTSPDAIAEICRNTGWTRNKHALIDRLGIFRMRTDDATRLFALASVSGVSATTQPEKIAPVQGYTPGIPWSLHLEAYDAYSKRWSPQPAMIDLEGRNCRGGFSTGELDSFIPGWRDRVSEISKLKARVAELEAQLASSKETSHG